jgi:hypothetical protein
MAHTVLDALSGEHILVSNSLGTVMNHCVVLRRGDNQAESVISLAVVSSVRKIKTTYPGLLVLAASAFLIAAAAYSSKQGGGAAGPIAFVGLLFVIAYWLSRRAAVAFTVDSEVTESVQGSPSEAAAIITAVETALERNRRLAA